LEGGAKKGIGWAVSEKKVRRCSLNPSKGGEKRGGRVGTQADTWQVLEVAGCRVFGEKKSGPVRKKKEEGAGRRQRELVFVMKKSPRKPMYAAGERLKMKAQTGMQSLIPLEGQRQKWHQKGWCLRWEKGGSWTRPRERSPGSKGNVICKGGERRALPWQEENRGGGGKGREHIFRVGGMGVASTRSTVSKEFLSGWTWL